MAQFEFWRDITVGSPNDTVDRYTYDTDDDSVTHDTFTTFSGTLGPINPPAGTIMYQTCVDGDRLQYKSRGNNTGLDITTIENSPSCCTITAEDFNLVKTNNTSLVTPNGTIVITAPVLDIGDYEASIDGGANFFTQVGGEIKFENLSAGNYSVIIREIAGVCNVTKSTVVVDNISYPPLLIEEETQPALYSPVFYPITLGFKLINNTATVKQDINGVYLEVGTDDGKDYLATLPIIKILDNEDYEGTYQIIEVDDSGDPQKFYIDATYTSDQVVLFVPFDRQVFQLFAEVAFNNYQKIADITVYPDNTGEYKLRLEGFLQSVFSVEQPVNNGDEITLLRKYYVMPRDFDMATSSTIYNAVFSAIPDLTSYLGDLIPLGPVPINFINEQTQKGYPVLFSYIDTTVGRVKNYTSSNQNDIVSNSALVFIPALPLDVIDVTWINPAGVIADLNVSPALPAWIVATQGPGDTLALHIDTGLGVEGGDYDGADYDGDDYLTGGPNAIVGCHEFEFFDGLTLLFTLEVCIYPIQTSNQLKCGAGEIFNIAWVNREGGWSSYAFEGKKTFGVEVDDIKTYKSNGIVKRQSIEGVFNTVEVSLSNKSIKDLIFISTLKKSIQAFLWSELTQQWSIPILLDTGNFPVYSLPFKQIDVNDKFTFKYAEEEVIQTQ